MGATVYSEIRESLRALYTNDSRPWMVGFSGGKDSTMVASLIVDAVLAQPPEAHKTPVIILCTELCGLSLGLLLHIVERDKAGERLLASGDRVLENSINFGETLVELCHLVMGWRDNRGMNGSEGPGPLTLEGRPKLLKHLHILHEQTCLRPTFWQIQ